VLGTIRAALATGGKLLVRWSFYSPGAGWDVAAVGEGESTLHKLVDAVEITR